RAQAMAEASRSLVGAAGAQPARPLDEIRDLLWVLCSPEVHQLFVAERLWTPERYEEWLAEVIWPLVSPDLPG
ncbi:MAG: hypothetical protein ABR540_11410, partial [Acidimicrobiales bacterium]